MVGVKRRKPRKSKLKDVHTKKLRDNFIQLHNVMKVQKEAEESWKEESTKIEGVTPSTRALFHHKKGKVVKGPGEAAIKDTISITKVQDAFLTETKKKRKQKEKNSL